MSDYKSWLEDSDYEKITLTEDEKRRFTDDFSSGDIYGLETLDEFIKEKTKDSDMVETIRDVSRSVLELNRMVTFSETFNGVHEYHESEIRDLYYTMMWELFALCGITEEDLKD